LRHASFALNASASLCPESQKIAPAVAKATAPPVAIQAAARRVMTGAPGALGGADCAGSGVAKVGVADGGETERSSCLATPTATLAVRVTIV